jgi:hypothetical protein
MESIEPDDIDVPLTSMSPDDLRQLKHLYEQSRAHYVKILEDTSALKEGDILAVKLCLGEVEKEIEEIDSLIAAAAAAALKN